MLIQGAIIVINDMPMDRAIGMHVRHLVAVQIPVRI